KTGTIPTVIGLALLFSSVRLVAQETAAQRHAMATNQLKQLATGLSERCLKDIRTLEDWQKQRAGLRQQLLYMLGLDPLPARLPLRAQLTGRLNHAGYRIEKLVFQS